MWIIATLAGLHINSTLSVTGCCQYILSECGKWGIALSSWKAVQRCQMCSRACTAKQSINSKVLISTVLKVADRSSCSRTVWWPPSAAPYKSFNIFSNEFLMNDGAGKMTGTCWSLVIVLCDKWAKPKIAFWLILKWYSDLQLACSCRIRSGPGPFLDEWHYTFTARNFPLHHEARWVIMLTNSTGHNLMTLVG